MSGATVSVMVLGAAGDGAWHGEREHGETPDDQSDHTLMRGSPDAEGHSHLLG
jgi:hypothetical protein